MRYLFAAALAFVVASPALAGPLTPPGAPAPTHKTLTEVEPRTAVNATNTPTDGTSIYVISQPGSYYLSGNVTAGAGFHGVKISSNNVTLDLNGFTIQGAGASSLNGIYMPGFQENIAIRNGHIRGFGQDGISSKIDIGVIEDIVVTYCGRWGIDNQTGGTYTTSIRRCHVYECGYDFLLEGGGIYGGHRSVIEDCEVKRVYRYGIRTLTESSVVDCTVMIVRSNVGENPFIGQGMLVSTASRANSNFVSGCERGIVASGQNTLISNNMVANCPTGVYSTSAGSTYLANRVSGSGNPFDLVAGNIALVESGVTSGAIAGLGGTAPASDPLANIVF